MSSNFEMCISALKSYWKTGVRGVARSGISLEIENFDLHQICDSGQCFRMREIGEERFEVIAGNRFLVVKQHENTVTFFCDEEELQGFWMDYFDLYRDYGEFIDRINPNDKYLTAAAVCGSGVRILKQDLWEMIVTFLISQQNNIKRIRHCIDMICEKYGEKMMGFDGQNYYAFPRAEAFTGLSEDALMACNLGYRSKYVVRTAGQVARGEIDLEAIAAMPYKKARQELLKVFGVGVKVADCICLFALHHLEAFPVDTHIQQVMDAHYKRGFPNQRYKDCRGVMQQYIFYYELNGGR